MIDLEEQENKVPICQKLNLTLREAAEYSKIGVNRLSDMVSNPKCDFALFVGKKKLIKREKFEDFINSDSTHFL